jgi:hypothetical protein
VVLIAAVAVFGKSRPSTSKTASSPGVSAGTGDGFAATFPFEPKRTTQQIQQAGISATVIIYDCLGSDEEVGVGVTQFPLTPDVSAADRILAGSIMGEADKTGTTVATQSATTYLGYPARDAVMTKDGTAIKSRVFLAGARLISLTSVTRSDADSRPGYERLLSTFHLQA